MNKYLKDFTKLTMQAENCESDNWIDACNFVGRMEDVITELKAENKRLTERVDELVRPLNAPHSECLRLQTENDKICKEIKRRVVWLS